MFFIIIALVFFWAVRKTLRKIQDQQKQTDREELPSSGVEETMVRCAHCSVHLPRSESITSQGEFFCSDEHRRTHLQ
jgi:uncharacterized protein